MQVFLDYLEKYDLLIELIITLLTIVLSMVAIFQTKNIAKKQLKQEENIAKQQADIQERQIKISVYEQKDKVNRALNVVFDTTARIRLLFTKVELKTFDQRKLHELLSCFVEGVDFKDIIYTLEQSRAFLPAETYQNIRMVRICFSSIDTSIDCLNLLKDEEETKILLMDDLRTACTEIESLQASIEDAMIQELVLV